MPKIKTNQTFVNLRNEEISMENKEKLNLGMVLAEILLVPHQDKKGFRPLKAWDLAQKFYKEKEVEIDNADFAQLKELVENNAAYIPMITAQALEKLEVAKD